MGVKILEWNQKEKALNRVLLFGVTPQRDLHLFISCDSMIPEKSWAFKSLGCTSFREDLGRKDRWQINWKGKKPAALLGQSKSEYAQGDLKMV